MHFKTLEWRAGPPGRLRLLDQTRLPALEVYLEIEDVEALHAAIRCLSVRGAPAIGVAAAYGVVLGAERAAALAGATREAWLGRTLEAAARLESARPTAVNLAWACRRMARLARASYDAGAEPRAALAALEREARAIHAEDVAACERMGVLGAELIQDGFAVLTHCNAGALATSGIGSGLAPIYHAHAAGKRVQVYADETRPLLQGARLTAWELAREGIPVTLITDGMAARVLSEGRVQAVFVGADRIAANGDVCNKIGTYGVALAAAAHAVPFYVVAPSSTFDAAIADGSRIPIEERGADEVLGCAGQRSAPPGIAVYNPAFDVTPARLVTALVTERGVVPRPDGPRLAALFGRGA